MIRAGMTVAEAILQLTKGFRKMMGRDPDGLEKIKIQQEAVKRIEEVNKVVDMEGNVIDTSKGIMGGKQIQDSPEFGARIRKTYDKAKGPGKGQEMVDALKSEGAQKTKSIMEDNLGMKLYGDETFEEILEIQRTGKHPRGEPKAEGGRIGYKDGPDKPGRRKFMKIMGGLATIPFIGKFFKGAKTAAPAVEKAAEVAGQAPSYFFDLAAKIKTLGRMSDGPSERIKEYSMKGKDGKSEFLLSEDIGTGEMQIKKIGKESDDMITDVQTMEYTPGSSMADETTKGIPADNYEEFTEYQSRIYKDEFNDPDIVDGIKVDEIIEEIKDQAPPIKKAGGGIARMLGE